MSIDLEKMYSLLPAIYRLRDADQGEPLKALLSVIAEQVGVLEEDLAQLYDDQFIETCAAWVVPYIGDLIGYRTLNDATQFGLPRAEVANTISYRRRKGTAAMLEQLARDVTRWDAHVVEFFLLLATTQYMNHLRPNNFYAPDLRKWEPLERLNKAFDRIAHTADMRRISSGRGRFNIPNIGIFLFRLNAYPLTESPAESVDAYRYLFSPMGNNTPLFSRSLADPQEDVTQLSKSFEVAMPLSRRVLDQYLGKYYGDGKKSILLKVDGNQVDISQIVVCDLSDISSSQWAHDPPKDKIAIDPVLGRIRFSSANSAPSKVLVTFHYGFAKDMGSGEYERAATFVETVAPVKVKSPATIQAALSGLGASHAVVEIDDSARYAESLSINAAANQHIELRAANHARPTIVLQSDFTIDGGANSEVTLNGLLITNKSIKVDGSIAYFRLRHCALVPGLTLDVNGKPQSPTEPSLVIASPNTVVEIDNCIIGGMRVTDGAQVKISNSIIDAMAETNVAFAASDGSSAGGSMQIVNSTVIGKIHTSELTLASNTIFMAALAVSDSWTAPVWSERKQEGCVRYSYVPPQSRTPHRFHCQPVSDADNLRVRPQFTSIHYGDPGYGQLSQRCALEIRQGADDESEMGAFHDLFQPQRETNLRVRLDEYLRFGLEAGIIYAT